MHWQCYWMIMHMMYYRVGDWSTEKKQNSLILKKFCSSILINWVWNILSGDPFESEYWNTELELGKDPSFTQKAESTLLSSLITPFELLSDAPLSLTSEMGDSSFIDSLLSALPLNNFSFNSLTCSSHTKDHKKYLKICTLRTCLNSFSLFCFKSNQDFRKCSQYKYFNNQNSETIEKVCYISLFLCWSTVSVSKSHTFYW